MCTYWIQLKETTKGVHNYGTAELELTDLVCNLHEFSQLLKHYYYEVLVDHIAIENMSKGKKEPMTNEKERKNQ